MAIKVLISGYENSGKTTLISRITDCLIINCDAKEFSIPVLHANYKEYKGIPDFTDFVKEKLKAYKDHKGETPKYIIFDTVTHFYSKMTKYNNSKFKGFEIHNSNNRDTMALNDMFELLVASGINVIIVAHTMFDKETGKHKIPAQGNFKDCGSFLSVCNEAIYIERSKDVHNIHLKSDWYPVRSLIEQEHEVVKFNDFDINAYLEKICNVKQETEKFRL